MGSLLLFAVGSPLIVDYEETCRRLEVSIAAAVANRDGAVFFSDPSRVRSVAQLTDALLGEPCLCPLFTPSNREIAVTEAASLGFGFAQPLIDPTAILASTVRLGTGSYVNAGAIIGAEARLGHHVLINRGAQLGHHFLAEDFVSVGPGATIGGQVTIGRGAMIGIGAVIMAQVTIGAGAIVGAGAVVTENVAAGMTVWGNPARIVRQEPSSAVKRA